jgi:gamma-glutamyltranspeptidase/glutathione hydrolase
MFCLFYNARTKKTHALNGSGRSAANISLDKIHKDLNLAKGDNGRIPMNSVHAVTVPGAAAGWVDAVEKFGSGKVTLEEIFKPAIELGEEGFPVSEIAASFVSLSLHCLIYYLISWLTC